MVSLTHLNKVPMDFGSRQGAREKADGLRGKPRTGLSARNGLQAGAEGSHSSAMAPTSNATFWSKDVEIVRGVRDTTLGAQGSGID
jgi:hypothetical protein